MTNRIEYDPSVWDGIYQSRGWGRYPGESLVRFVARNFFSIPDRSQIRFLEVGCGPGANLWFLAREGFEVYGIDMSPTAIQLAHQRLDKECPDWKGELVVGDICKLPFEDNFFDAVIDNEAIYCNSFEKSKKIYIEVHRVLKPGGKLYSRTFATGMTGDGTGKKVGYNTWEVQEGPLAGKGIVRFTDESDIPDLLERFQIEHVDILQESHFGQKYMVKEWIIVASK